MSAKIIQLGSPAKQRRERQRKRSESSLAWFEAFGARLRAFRLTLGVSEAEATAACLTTLHTYRKYEAGLPHRSWHLGLVSFARKYDLSYTWLLAGGGPMRASEYELVLAALTAYERPKLTTVPSDHSA